MLDSNVLSIVGLIILFVFLLVLRQLNKAGYRKIEADKQAAKEQRIAKINKLRPKVGDKNADMIIEGEIAIGWHPKMVALSWGEPTKIDQKEITETSTKERWVYGRARRGSPAKYVYFKDNKVTKIQA